MPTFKVGGLGFEEVLALLFLQRGSHVARPQLILCVLPRLPAQNMTRVQAAGAASGELQGQR